MKAPACEPGDLCMAQRAESTLFMPEIAKSACTPKRFQHVSLFPFFEIGFIGWIVRVGFAFDLDVPFDGSPLGVVQPDFICLSFVIAGFTEEGPIPIPALGKVFRLTFGSGNPKAMLARWSYSIGISPKPRSTCFCAIALRPSGRTVHMSRCGKTGFACLKIVIFETFRVRDNSSAVRAQSCRSICSARDNGCPSASEACTVLDVSCEESRTSDEKGL